MIISALLLALGVSVQDSDWPWWRGPNRDGAAAENQKVPLTWSAFAPLRR